MNLAHFLRAARVNLVNVLMSANFAVAVLLGFGVLFAEIIGPLQSVADLGFSAHGDAYYFNISLHFGYYIYAAPLVCAFASGGLFYDDWEAGFSQLRLMKSGRIEYKYGLWVGVTLGGGLAVMLANLLFAVACSISFGPQHPATILQTADGWLWILAGAMGNWMYMFANALLGLMFGTVWSGVGLLVATIMPNRYVSYLAPFIVCFSLEILLPDQYRPLEMLVQMNWEGFTFPQILAYQLIFLIVVLCCYAVSFNRRIIHA